MTAEFTDTTFLNKYLSDASTALVLTFTGGTIANGQSEKLIINVSAVKFDADTPNVASPGVIDLAMSFEAYDDGSNAPLTITYQTADAAL